MKGLGNLSSRGTQLHLNPCCPIKFTFIVRLVDQRIDPRDRDRGNSVLEAIHHCPVTVADVPSHSGHQDLDQITALLCSIRWRDPLRSLPK
jgi:hypothetical protein